VPDAIEETLRFDSPALSAGRILTEDTELFAQPMAAGTWLRLMTAAIGRDPGRNSDPDRYSVTRPRKEYAAFGGGLHHCLGMHLGKLEAIVALNMLLDRYPEFTLADTPTPASRRGIPGFRGFEHLMIDVP
jgi:cytochrome P450